eukprot:ANDGO_03205.mRNA.1 hypothetical protein
MAEELSKDAASLVESYISSFKSGHSPSKKADELMNALVSELRSSTLMFTTSNKGSSTPRKGSTGYNSPRNSQKTKITEPRVSVTSSTTNDFPVHFAEGELFVNDLSGTTKSEIVPEIQSLAASSLMFPGVLSAVALSSSSSMSNRATTTAASNIPDVPFESSRLSQTRSRAGTAKQMSWTASNYHVTPPVSPSLVKEARKMEEYNPLEEGIEEETVKPSIMDSPDKQTGKPIDPMERNLLGEIELFRRSLKMQAAQNPFHNAATVDAQVSFVKALEGGKVHGRVDPEVRASLDYTLDQSMRMARAASGYRHSQHESLALVEKTRPTRSATAAKRATSTSTSTSPDPAPSPPVKSSSESFSIDLLKRLGSKESISQDDRKALRDEFMKSMNQMRRSAPSRPSDGAAQALHSAPVRPPEPIVPLSQTMRRLHEIDNPSTMGPQSDEAAELSPEDQKKILLLRSYESLLDALRKEEERMKYIKRLEEQEIERPPIDTWYTMKSTRFGYELSKLNKHDRRVGVKPASPPEAAKPKRPKAK